ncbi:MAG: aminopeptidase P family protein [Myxococcales bacterium]|nr:aminopeptidase P family protein [Myxococcales bacterium]
MKETAAAAFVARRNKLAEHLGAQPALLAAGRPRARNYAANRYPFRAESHFLYLVGQPLAGATLLVDGGRSVLFLERPADDDALWHGEVESPEAIRAATGVDEVRWLDALSAAVAGKAVATLPPQEDQTASFLGEVLGRTIAPRSGTRLEGADARLADAMIALRLHHDAAALAEMRDAATITERAHRAGARALRPGVKEAAVKAAIEAEMTAVEGTPAYGSIVTTHGEVLHAEHAHRTVQEGDLLLVDAGTENRAGWASDVTRVYPASRRFSATQRAIYDLVLAANRQGIEMVRPGVRYRDIHLAAARVMLEGLVHLGVFRGAVDGLLERGAGAVFFPHGVGHLLGLDVHDMEDLGDRAGYAPGRARSKRFGDAYLRLDRDLAPGMCVTIEPGFYQVPAILGGEVAAPFANDLDNGRLEAFRDVRGIRLEDDVLCTDGAPEVLTRAIPIAADDVLHFMS